MTTRSVVSNVAESVQDVPTMATIMPPLGHSFNLSLGLNFSSIISMLPGSKFFSRLAKGSFSTELDIVDLPSSSVGGIERSLTEAVRTEAATPSARAELPFDTLQFPGPWGFFTSWYMLGLITMGVVLHRMQNIVIPSRVPSRRPRHARGFAPRLEPSSRFSLLLHELYGSILPLNASNTTTRLILHLPSVYFLCKMLLMWSLLVLQTCDLLPSFTEVQLNSYWGIFQWMDALGKWSSQKDMSDICWSTFSTVCAAFLVEGFVKALDGLRTGFLSHTNPNTSPFNLVGYAFLLHVYSSPITHMYTSSDLPSRPDKHVIITIAIPLLQLTIFHFLSISKSLSRHRLLPTALGSLLSLAHFHGTLLHHFFLKPSLSPPSPTTRMTRSSYIRHATGNYPLLNYIPNIFETLVIAIILLTVLLNAIFQILVRGRVDRVLSGMGIGPGSLLHDDDESTSSGFFQTLPFEEDFGLLLLRVGTACLEATGLRGWGNEVAPIELPIQPRVIKHPRPGQGTNGSPAETTYGSVRIGRLDTGKVQYGSSSSSSAGTSSSGFQIQRGVDVSTTLTMRSKLRTKQTRTAIQRRGFFNEVRNVDVGVTGAGNNDAWQGQRRSAKLIRWVTEVAYFLRVLFGVLKGLVMFLLDRARGKVHNPPLPPSKDGMSCYGDVGEEDFKPREEISEEERQRMEERELYHRFLRGEDISDDDEEDEAESLSSEEDDESEDNEGDEGSDGDQREAEAVRLFTDLIRGGGSSQVEPSSSISTTAIPGLSNRDPGEGEMMLAHVIHQNPGTPLTRRRWNALVSGKNPSKKGRGDEDEISQDAPFEAGTSYFSEQMQSNMAEMQDKLAVACVICIAERRDVICWPCRCLAMCDNCREALASKSAPSKHRCPCCRQIAEGYSKIYIP